MTAPTFDDAVATAVATRRYGDYASALRLFHALADQGDPTAQYNLGVMYRKGEGVPQDYAKAAKWHTLAADQGNANSQFYLGIMYEKGQGVPQDDAVSHRWFDLSAARGDQEAVKSRDTAPPRMTAAIKVTRPDEVPLSKEGLEQLIAQITETHMSAVAVIDAVLAQDLLDRTRSDLKALRDEAVAGSLRADDEKYVRQLYTRIPALKTPDIPEVRWSAVSSPIGQNWPEGFLGRITLVGAVIIILISVLVGITAFLETDGSLPDRILKGLFGAGLAGLGFLLLVALAAWLVMAGLRVISLALRAVYWLFVGK